ncbi:MAG TPA: MerR family transcriptional regulator [Acidimicrobiales bacterium]|jgi:DNA-binding transcriptional MerR regulator|nr:MerR family transcriptional regulator [Acidimicrobiales bacterium]
MDPDGAAPLTIDDLATATGTTSRRIRSLQTLGLLDHPALHGRTGLYDAGHRDRLEAVLRLQVQGFSLESLVVLFDAVQGGRTLAAVLGGEETAASTGVESGTDSADLYGFADLQRAGSVPRRGRPFLSVVPTTVWGESQAS